MSHTEVRVYWWHGVCCGTVDVVNPLKRWFMCLRLRQRFGRHWRQGNVTVTEIATGKQTHYDTVDEFLADRDGVVDEGFTAEL